jgi:6-phosphogluconolactonase
VFAVDLGGDKINVLTLDLATDVLAPNAVPFIPVSSGSGPRHMAFHVELPRAYVLDELASTITVFSYDAARGSAIWLQTISTVPADFAGTNTSAEIRIHPSGRFLYNTNRGHDSVALFEIDDTTGKLSSLGWQATGGQWPRGMNIDPSGSFLYVANQNTNDITTFRIHRSGRLQRSASTSTPTPVDIAFGPITAD